MMAFRTGQHSTVAPVDRVDERFVRDVTGRALARRQGSEIDRMFEAGGARVLLGRTLGVRKDRVTEVAVVSDHLARVALVIAVVTAETTRRRQVSDVVWTR